MRKEKTLFEKPFKESVLVLEFNFSNHFLPRKSLFADIAILWEQIRPNITVERTLVFILKRAHSDVDGANKALQLLEL